MKIGRVSILNKVALAPMAGITDKAFRLIARQFGCGLIYTEMISAKALTYNNTRTKMLLDLSGEEGPLAVQLFGSEPETMSRAAMIAEQEGAQIIDINMGCPVPKVFRNGEGSALLEKPELACEIIRQMTAAVKVPITVKMRSGLNSDKIVAVQLAEKLAQAGASALAVHGRTRDQYYAGKADWQVIKEVKEAVPIPVIGNGDIWSPQDAQRMLEATGCDAVMLGRGVLGNPWLITNTVRFLQGRDVLTPSIEEKISCAITHLDLVVNLKGEENGIKEMRKQLAWYLKGLPYTADMKKEIFKAVTWLEVIKLLEDYLAFYAGMTS